jgi:hypothetical protein
MNLRDLSAVERERLQQWCWARVRVFGLRQAGVARQLETRSCTVLSLIREFEARVPAANRELIAAALLAGEYPLKWYSCGHEQGPAGAA